MKKLTTALLVAAMTAGSLAATEGASLAASRHRHRPVAQKMFTAKKGKKRSIRTASLEARKVRKTRKGKKVDVNPNNGPVPVTG